MGHDNTIKLVQTWSDKYTGMLFQQNCMQLCPCVIARCLTPALILAGRVYGTPFRLLKTNGEHSQMLILHFPLEMMPYSIPIVLLILFTFFTEVENIYFYLNGLESSDPDLNSKWTMNVGVGVRLASTYCHRILVLSSLPLLQTCGSETWNGRHSCNLHTHTLGLQRSRMEQTDGTYSMQSALHWRQHSATYCDLIYFYDQMPEGLKKCMYRGRCRVRCQEGQVQSRKRRWEWEWEWA